MDPKECAAEKTTGGESSKLMEAMEEFSASPKSMDPAAETTTGEEPNDLMEATESVEESSAAATARPLKRKAKSGPEIEERDDKDEESGDKDEEGGEEDEEGGEEDEESGEEDEEMGEKYSDSSEEALRWKYPEWGEDSYDEREYHPSEEDLFNDPEVERKWRRYKLLVTGTNGFYVEPGLRPMWSIGGVKPVLNLDALARFGKLTHRQFFEQMARLCLKRYNEENSLKNGFTVEFVEVVRGNYSIGRFTKSYITFKAREKPDEPPVEYQAKVWSTYIEGENTPILCRPAPPSANKFLSQD